VLAANPRAAVVRIDWQIDEHASGNNMLAALDQWQQREGRVNASRAWRPACSFMIDTADAILKIIVDRVSGIVPLDGNADERHTFAQTVVAMKAQFLRNQ
jgi:dTDP-4-dehydrorhamnose reductase